MGQSGVPAKKVYGPVTRDFRRAFLAGQLKKGVSAVDDSASIGTGHHHSRRRDAAADVRVDCDGSSDAVHHYFPQDEIGLHLQLDECSRLFAHRFGFLAPHRNDPSGVGGSRGERVDGRWFGVGVAGGALTELEVTPSLAIRCSPADRGRCVGAR